MFETQFKVCWTERHDNVDVVAIAPSNWEKGDYVCFQKTLILD